MLPFFFICILNIFMISNSFSTTFLYDFSRKIFLMLDSINWPNFILLTKTRNKPKRRIFLLFRKVFNIDQYDVGLFLLLF